MYAANIYMMFSYDSSRLMWCHRSSCGNSSTLHRSSSRRQFCSFHQYNSHCSQLQHSPGWWNPHHPCLDYLQVQSLDCPDCPYCLHIISKWWNDNTKNHNIFLPTKHNRMVQMQLATTTCRHVNSHGFFIILLNLMYVRLTISLIYACTKLTDI